MYNKCNVLESSPSHPLPRSMKKVSSMKPVSAAENVVGITDLDDDNSQFTAHQVLSWIQDTFVCPDIIFPFWCLIAISSLLCPQIDPKHTHQVKVFPVSVNSHFFLLNLNSTLKLFHFSPHASHLPVSKFYWFYVQIYPESHLIFPHLLLPTFAKLLWYLN